MAKKPSTGLVPAAARAPEILTEGEQHLNAGAIDTFIQLVGGRDALVDVLSVASAAPDVDRVVNYLLDPRYERWSLRRLCNMAGITVADLLAAYRKAMIAKAHVEATHIIAAKLPPVVEDVMTKAISDPTVERHKLALELGQLTERRSGLFIQQNQIQNASAASLSQAGGGALEQLQQAVGDLLFNPARRRAAAPREDLGASSNGDT